MTEHVGWIGLGLLGLPMATNVVDAGYAVTVWNRTASKAAPLVARGAELAEDAIGVAQPGGTIVTSLWDGAAVESVVTPELLERLRGGLHVSTTTMLPATSQQLAERHAAHGVAFVEVPVFGRPEAAAAKQLALPIAGSARDKERAQPVLAALGAAHVFDLGETFGAALATKLAGNFMIASAVRTFAEALTMAIHAGADPARVVQMLTATLFSAPIYKSYGERLLAGLAKTGTVGTGFVSKIPEKDLGLVVDTAGTLAMPIAHLIQALVSARPRAVAFDTNGGFDVLKVVERDVRAPGTGEVRIRVKAAAVSPTDLLLRELGAGDVPRPWVAGMDAAGVIESVGPGVERLRVGDRVMAACNPRRPEGGAQSELLVVPAAAVVAMPAGASFAEASTLPMNGLTALLGLRDMALTAGQTLAVSGGAGLLAHYAIGLAKQRGLRVIADAKPADVERVTRSGADFVIPRNEQFADEVRKIAPLGADALFDTAMLHERGSEAVKDGGSHVVVRGTASLPPGWSPPRGITLRPIFVSTVLERTDWLEQLRDLAANRTLTLEVANEYPPERAADAQRAMAAGGLRGRAVIVF